MLDLVLKFDQVQYSTWFLLADNSKGDCQNASGWSECTFFSTQTLGWYLRLKIPEERDYFFCFCLLLFCCSMKCEINSEMKGAFFAILQHEIQFKQIKDCLVQITKSSFQLYLLCHLPIWHKKKFNQNKKSGISGTIFISTIATSLWFEYTFKVVQK